MVILMGDLANQIKTEILFKALSACVIPILAYVISLNSDLSRNDQRLKQLEKDTLTLVRQLEETNDDLSLTQTTLAEIKITLEFIRKALEQ